jgi:uncharacterized membrane protein YdjX (TVP38/TMEM64 family)
MAENKPPVSKKTLLLSFAILGLAVLLVAAYLLRHMTIPELVECGRSVVTRVKEWSKTVGPIPFFAAMALLPAFGFPITVFSLTAGVLFVPQIGLGWTLVGALLALGSNMALTYWMARYALRPLLGGIVRKLGYGLPEVSRENHLGMTLLFRIMPGPPFFAQNYILGLAEIRFWTYLWVSWLIQGFFAVAMVVFTDRLMQGSGKVIFLSVSVFVAVMIVIKMVVRRISRKKAEAKTA